VLTAIEVLQVRDASLHREEEAASSRMNSMDSCSYVGKA
jgi:hypothetical protein